MSRIKIGKVTRRRHQNLIKEAKGFYGIRKSTYGKAKETLLRAWSYAFTGRKLKKRDMRSLFIIRINAAAREHGLSYSVFMNLLKTKNIELNRKMLSQIAVYEPTVFESIVKSVKN